MGGIQVLIEERVPGSPVAITEFDVLVCCKPKGNRDRNVPQLEINQALIQYFASYNCQVDVDL